MKNLPMHISTFPWLVPIFSLNALSSLLSFQFATQPSANEAVSSVAQGLPADMPMTRNRTYNDTDHNPAARVL